MSTEHPRVGVVVLNYRGVADTIACLESLAALRRSGARVVVDNGSADGSAERLAAVPGVELIVNESNLGFAAGNNVAIERLLADGFEFVWVLNNDTVVEPGCVARLLAVADADPRIGAVGSVIYDLAAPDRVLDVGRWVGRPMDRPDPGRPRRRRPGRLPDRGIRAVARPARSVRSACSTPASSSRGRTSTCAPGWSPPAGASRSPSARGSGIGGAARSQPLAPKRLEQHAAGLVAVPCAVTRRCRG